MKKIYLIFTLLYIQLLGFAQDIKQSSEVIVADHFNITRPLKEIFKENPVDETRYYKKIQSGDRKNRIPAKFLFTAEKDGYLFGNDTNSMQKEMGAIPSEPTRANAAGQSATGFRPMDPSGAVGPNHYVQMINSTTFRIYNKTTMAVLLTGTLGNLWSPATGNNGDPIVMYDKPADRWFLAQFGNSTDKKIYIAISTTNDPLGTYYTYTYTSAQFPDYLKFSVWADGYYMTSNQTQQKVFCFNRAEMLAGVPAARSIVVNYNPPKSGFFCPLPGDAGDGTLPAYGTPCPIMSYSDNGWGGTNIDAINIYNMNVDWTPAIPTATITLNNALPTAAFDASYNSSWNDCVQPGTTQKLDGIGGVLMYRAQWKSWTGYNSMVLNWGVNISAAQRSIKWCEMRQNQSTGVWTMFQEGIYVPDGATRWMGSIAMDNNGSIGLTYIKSDATTIYPGLYYTGRRNTDPLGTLPITEAMAVAGTGYQTGTNRVGDYAHTCLDPDGVTFWTTSEYMGGTSGGSAAATRIYSFQITPTTNTAIVNIAQTTGTNPQCPGSVATFTATPTNGGTTPSYQWKINGTNVGTNSSIFTTSSITNGQIVSCVMTSSLVGVLSNPATSNTITMNITPISTPSISISQTIGSNPFCPGSYNVFIANVTNGGNSPSYQWKINGVNVGTNSSTYTTTTLSNGQQITCELTSNQICVTSPNAISNSITMNEVSNSPASVTIVQTVGANPFCPGSMVEFSASVANGLNPIYQWKVDGTNVGSNSSSFSSSSLTNGQQVSCEVSVQPQCQNEITIGNINSTTLNSTTSNTGAAYPTYYGSGRQQYLIRASELTALGLTAGNLNSIAFKINGTVGDPATLNGYTIKLGPTTSTTMNSTFKISTFTTVFGPINYTPITNAINVHTFSTPYSWDGTSNLLVDICFSNQVTGTVAYQNYQTSTSFVSATRYQVDGATGATACTNASGTSASMRPNMTFTSGGLGTIINSNSIVVSTNIPSPSISIAQTSGTNPSCIGTSLSFTANVLNAGTNAVFQWKRNGLNVGTNNSTYTASNFSTNDIISCQYSATSSCGQPVSISSNSLNLIRNSLPIVTANNVSGCVGSAIALQGTPSGGTFNKPNPYSGPSTTYSYTYTNANGCTSTSSLATITVSACSSQVSVKLFIEGYYEGLNAMKPVKLNQGVGNNSSLVDDITIELINPTSTPIPMAIIATQVLPLSISGNANATFNVPTGSYYIVIKHRNSIRTWSALPITFNGSIINYDFSTSSSQAYGQNMKQMSTNQWALYTGDIDQNGAVEVGDYSLWEFDSMNFNFGYLTTDLDGNGAVDLVDYSIWELNSIAFSSEVTP